MKKDEKKPQFILCPRCELNYIPKKEKLCPVCKAELGLVDKSILIPDEDEIERICPVCKVNYLGEDEDVCFMCQKEHAAPAEEKKTWEAEDAETAPIEEELEISLEFAAEEEEEEEEEEKAFKEPDDFDYDVDPAEFLDEDEEEEEDDDDDDDFFVDIDRK